jgi:hypothetical protein
LGETPSFAPGGSEVQFQFRNIPIAEGGKAYYAAAVDLEIRGTATGDGASSTAETYARQLRTFLGKLRLYNSFRGMMVDETAWSNAIRCSTFGYVQNGYRNPHRSHIGAGTNWQAAVANVFFLRVRVPLGLGLGEKPAQTWPLVAELKEAFLGVTPAASGLGLIDAGMVFANVKISACILMQPRPELVLGPGIESILYSGNTPSGTAFEGRIDDWGQRSGFGGNVTRDAGVIWAGINGDAAGDDGMTGMHGLTEIEIPWRNIYGMRDYHSLIEDAQDAEGRPGWYRDVLDRSLLNAANPVDSNGGYPFVNDTNLSGLVPAGGTSTLLYQSGGYLAALPFVNPTPDVELSKIQVAKSALTVRLQGSVAFAGKFNIMAIQAKEWTPQFREEWTKMCVREGLVKEVLGTVSSPSDLRWTVKAMRKQGAARIEPSKARFLPTRLQNANEGRKVRY